MVRHIDTEMTVMNEEVYTSRALGILNMPLSTGPHREAPGVGQEVEEAGEKCARAFIVVSIGKA